MNEEDMREMMKEIGEKWSMVNDMDAVPVEVIDQLVSEMERKIMMNGGYYGS